MENIVAFVDQAAAEAGRQRKRQADKLASLKRKQQKLERSIEQLELAESLKTHGGKAWMRLDRKERWRKKHVLAVLLCASQKLPEELKEGDLWRCKVGRYSVRVPRELREDRDILLARLARKDFSECYSKLYVKGTSFRNPPLFQVPQQFRNDKEVLIATVSQYPEILLQDFFSAEFLDDLDVFHAYIRSERLKYRKWVGAGCNSNTLFNLLSKFSDRIRGIKSLMLKAAKRTSANTVLESFSDRLAGDFSFVRGLLVLLQDSSPKEDVLGRFSESVRAERSIVLAFVQKNGRCLKHADESLKSDLNIIRAACQNDASAFAFVAPNTALGNDKDFLLDVFSRWSCEQQGDPRLYGRFLSRTLKLDLDLLALAHKTGNLSPDDLPPELTAKNGFWMEMVQRESSFWRILPVDLAESAGFAHAIDTFCDNELVAEVFERFPYLIEERSVWQAIIASSLGRSNSGVKLRFVIEKHAQATVLQDKALMVSACGKNFKVYSLLDSELQQDRDVVEAAINCSGLALQLIPHSVQTHFPELVVKALEALVPDNVDLIHNDYYHGNLLASALWTNMDVVRAWFRAGGDFLPNQFTRSMANNKDFGLALAERFGGIYYDLEEVHANQNMYFRDEISVDLRSNKDFMMKACKLDPFLFLEAAGVLRRDVDLAIMAFSGDQDADDLLVQWLLGNNTGVYSRFVYYHEDDDAYNEELSFLYRVQVETKARIARFDSFIKGFLPGMSEHAGPNCHLRMLAKGAETSIALKKSIASYLGVPAEKELSMLQNAAHNLSNLPSFRHMCSHCNRSG